MRARRGAARTRLAHRVSRESSLRRRQRPERRRVRRSSCESDLRAGTVAPSLRLFYYADYRHSCTPRARPIDRGHGESSSSRFSVFNLVDGVGGGKGKKEKTVNRVLTPQTSVTSYDEEYRFSRREFIKSFSTVTLLATIVIERKRRVTSDSFCNRRRWRYFNEKSFETLLKPT